MASAKGNGTTAAAEQLGAISLGESAAERKDDTTAKNGTTPTPTKKLCSACEKESKNLKMCNGCRCVWYCGKKCQNKHRKEHKNECKRVKEELDKRGGKLNLGTEKDVGPLGKLPPQEECPICMHVLPFHGSLHNYFSCCGKRICMSCAIQHQLKSEQGTATCAFCREPIIESDEEHLERLRKRIERKDPQAVFNMAVEHGWGRRGLTVDQAKCIDLYRQAADLGLPAAQYELGSCYKFGKMGLEQNEEEALEYWGKAAEGGGLSVRHSIGSTEWENGDVIAAMGHWRLSASGGYKYSMENLLTCFEDGLLQHGDLSEAMRAFYRSRAERKSEDRDKYIQYLKLTGKYQQEYDF